MLSFSQYNLYIYVDMTSKIICFTYICTFSMCLMVPFHLTLTSNSLLNSPVASLTGAFCFAQLLSCTHCLITDWRRWVLAVRLLTFCIKCLSVCLSVRVCRAAPGARVLTVCICLSVCLSVRTCRAAPAARVLTVCICLFVCLSVRTCRAAPGARVRRRCRSGSAGAPL